MWSVLGVPAGQPPGEWHRTSCLLSSGHVLLCHGSSRGQRYDDNGDDDDGGDADGVEDSLLVSPDDETANIIRKVQRLAFVLSFPCRIGSSNEGLDPMSPRNTS